MKIAIINIGNELLNGDIINSNLIWLGNELINEGIRINIQLTIPDNVILIKESLDYISKSHDIIITTGGLGPTDDDITKQALSELSKVQLVFNEEVFENINCLYRHKGEEFLKNNIKQAFIPENAIPLQNNIGTAPSLKIIYNNCTIYSLPGVPTEMKYLFNQYIIPEIVLSNQKNISVHIFNVLFFNIPESELQARMKKTDVFSYIESLAYLPSPYGIKLRFELLDYEFENNIKQIIQSHFLSFEFAFDSRNIICIVDNLLKTYKYTVAVAESCTGGLLGSKLTEISGSSQYFLGGLITYSNNSKVKRLGINQNTIDIYCAVSKETAYEMALNIKEKFDSDFGIAITGIAGPEGSSKDKPVGTVFIGISYKNEIDIIENHFIGDREFNRNMSVGKALMLLYKKIKFLEQN